MQKMKLIFLLVGSLGLLQAQTLTLADQMPYFPGCERFEDESPKKRNCSNQLLVSFISNHLKYPEEAQKKEVEGTVYVSFVVNSEGLVTDHSILKDIGSHCGEAAIEVIRKMPNWEPAIHEGQPVAVKLNLPIQFSFTPQATEEDVPFKVHWGMLKAQQISRTQLQAHSAHPVQVRDLFGNDVALSELLFIYEKKRTYAEARSNGRLNEKMRRLIQRAKKGGIFTVVATVQENGQFVYVERQFEIID